MSVSFALEAFTKDSVEAVEREDGFALKWMILSKTFVSSLCVVMEAQLGMLYCVKQDTEDMSILLLSGSYGCRAENVRHAVFKSGEGLLGQCAESRTAMDLKDVPEDYLEIQSGLGSSSPKQILLCPLEYEDQLLAVLELTTLNPFSQNKRHLLAQVLANVGVVL